MSFANNITRLTEIAVRDYLRGAGLALNSEQIKAGFDDEEMGTPRVVVACNQAEVDGPGDDAVWQCRVEIRCVSNADDRTEDEHHQFAGQVFSQLMIGRPETAQAITDASAEAFNCQDILPVDQNKDLSDRRWVSVLGLRLACCGSDLD